MKQIKSLALGWIVGILSAYLLFGIAMTFDIRDAFASMAKAILDAVITVPLFHQGSLDWKTLFIIMCGASIGAVIKFKHDDFLGKSEQPKWETYMGDYKEKVNITKNDDLILYKNPNGTNASASADTPR